MATLVVLLPLPYDNWFSNCFDFLTDFIQFTAYIFLSDGASFVDPFCCYFCFLFIFITLACLFPAALLSHAGKGLTS